MTTRLKIALALNQYGETTPHKLAAVTRIKHPTIAVTLTRMKEQGLVENKVWGFWKLTPKGEGYVQGVLDSVQSFI
jgi:Mn-dependent DtxR family transcriptional regulator